METDSAHRQQEVQEPAERREFRLTAPLTEEQVRELKVGDVVILDGLLHTGRDALHKYLLDHDSPVDLNGAVIYHCGPVMSKEADGGWKVKAAGPTTSIREEPYQGDIMKKFGIRAVIGKGGWERKPLWLYRNMAVFT
ncbi:fumarate hydratase C-terminal domain-containing protein [Paenibacillus larvae]|nr:fumarate hydratase C-terminal domain-containing protein [Paenibacillus larvae]MDT2258604.1 fumarate hydratase C-terminal domain-containing protein [Paenibacillus larvae]MDT2274099.1 fumarate hydratase C-terminal domain-containing protein [Paenibacillus larvae]